MQVVKEREGAIVRRVHLLGDNGEPIAAVTRFLDHLAERGYSPYTLCAYAYDLQNLFTFLASSGRGARVAGVSTGRCLTAPGVSAATAESTFGSTVRAHSDHRWRIAGPSAVGLDGEPHPCRSSQLL